MNIKQAKEYIKNAVNLYLKKDEFGEYRVPVVRQRPIFLLGAPGIGKTAVMEQIAQEMGIALVAYSMTHHTRQSALGLPYITQKTYGQESFSVSEYTMSEIIASIYDTMESSGMKEGILFLDEINCVSETLAPSMLQFLQYKIFGRHRVPEGWVIVTAGNPPEYNKSVREFDVVTLDRLKVLEVEPDLRIWKEYALERRVHNAIVNYLDIKKDHFYCMEMTTKGRSYVTARGWEDLSEMLSLYEEEQLPVDETLVAQYLRNDRVVKEFTAYYDLYQKYKRDYRIGEILEGNPSVRAIARAKEAAFDERLSLIGMLLDKVQADMQGIMEQAELLTDLKNPLKAIGNAAKESYLEQLLSLMDQQIEGRKKLLENLQNANSLSQSERRRQRGIIAFLEEHRKQLVIGRAQNGAEAYEYLKNKYSTLVAKMKQDTIRVQGELHAMFAFAEEAFGRDAESGNEMLVLITQLTVNVRSAQFIATFGSPDYKKYNETMMLSERGAELQAQIAELKL